MAPDDPNNSTPDPLDFVWPSEPEEPDAALPSADETPSPEEPAVAPVADIAVTEEVEIAPPTGEDDTAVLAATRDLSREPADEADAPAPVVDMEPSAGPGPASAAPPRIVAETPIGGRPQPAPSARPVPEPPASVREPTPGEPETMQAPADAALPAVEPPAGPPVRAARPVAGAVPVLPPAEAESVAGAGEWDEDLSPELAAVLFHPPDEAAAITLAPDGEIAASVPRARAIHLTDTADARTTPITAQGVSAPPPDSALTGQARYRRTEEPLRANKGQRIVERWDYLGRNRPTLDGRQVNRVYAREVTYTDGSWHWLYERHYADGGRDRREVRANTDRTYIERADEVKSGDPATNKRVRRQEHEAMIFAGPEREEQRGFFSRLLGRIGGGGGDGEKSWRAATPQESRHARKHGGMAFKRSFLRL